jgi:hypothetical protein
VANVRFTQKRSFVAGQLNDRFAPEADTRLRLREFVPTDEAQPLPVFQNSYYCFSCALALGQKLERARSLFDQIPVRRKRGAHVFNLALGDVRAKGNMKPN